MVRRATQTIKDKLGAGQLLSSQGDHAEILARRPVENRVSCRTHNTEVQSNRPTISSKLGSEKRHIVAL